MSESLSEGRLKPEWPESEEGSVLVLLRKVKERGWIGRKEAKCIYREGVKGEGVFLHPCAEVKKQHVCGWKEKKGCLERG